MKWDLTRIGEEVRLRFFFVRSFKPLRPTRTAPYRAKKEEDSCALSIKELSYYISSQEAPLRSVLWNSFSSFEAASQKVAYLAASYSTEQEEASFSALPAKELSTSSIARSPEAICSVSLVIEFRTPTRNFPPLAASYASCRGNSAWPKLEVRTACAADASYEAVSCGRFLVVALKLENETKENRSLQDLLLLGYTYYSTCCFIHCYTY